MKKKYVKPSADIVPMTKEMSILGSRMTETSEQMSKRFDMSVGAEDFGFHFNDPWEAPE